MNVTLKLFSLAKDLAGFEERRISVDPPARADDILQYLVDLNPKFEQWKSSLRLAVNLEYVNSDHPLQDGDEVAVIPPVSGG
ncbi:MAG TPA: MoaD/ThiS family protein, partial [Bacteroidota bacterium]|nr:MoaD/ThiS family protein [Bacteroidota bacterium]